MKIKIADIKLGKRLREDDGDLHELAASLDHHGLLHPIVVDDGDRVVAGGRRLKAAKILKWKHIAVTRLGTLSKDEREVLEFEENVRRKDLTSIELSRETKAVTVAAEKKLKAAVKKNGLRGKLPQKGRPSEAGSERAIQQETGIDGKEQRRASRHVTLCDTFPFMTPWKQAQALKIGSMMEDLPKAEQKAMSKLIGDQPFPLAPKGVKRVLDNMAEMEAEDRKGIYDLHKSSDTRDKSLAITRAYDAAPEPDPRELILIEIERRLRRAAKMFENDAFNGDLVSIADRCQKLMKAIEKERKSW